MKTYLMVWFNSEGAKPQDVVNRLQGIGFKPMRGPYDHVYEWEKDVDLDRIRRSYLRNALNTFSEGQEVTEIDVQFLAEDMKTTAEYVRKVIQELHHGTTN